MALSRLILAASISVVVALSRTLSDYVAAFTGSRSADDAGIKKCLADNVRLNFPIALDQTGRRSRQSTENFILHTMLQSNPEVAPLTACLVTQNLVQAEVYAELGASLLFACATPRIPPLLRFPSTSSGVTELFTALVSRGVARNYTLGIRGKPLLTGHTDPDGFNILHKLLGTDKRLTDEFANDLLQPALASEYDGRLIEVGDHIASLLQRVQGEVVRESIRALMHQRRVLSPNNGKLLGQTMSSSHIIVLMGTVAQGLVGVLAGTPAPASQPSLSTLVSQQDRFGRTPLHMAALQNNFDAISLLMSLLNRSTFEGIVCAKDALGYTAAELATFLGYHRFENYFPELSCNFSTSSIISADMTTTHSPAYPSVRSEFKASDTAVTDDGGWRDPVYTPRAAQVAIATSTALGALCDFDSIDGASFTADMFVKSYFIPMRPVILRGQAAANSHAWRRSAFLKAHGDVLVQPTAIPYATEFGGEPADTIKLRAFVARLMSCSPGNATKPTSPKCTPYVDSRQGSDSTHVPYVFKRLRLDSSQEERALLKSLIHSPTFLADARVPTWPDGEIPLLAETADALSAELFIGGPGSGAPMHFHGDALNSLMFGRKAWYLVPPSRAEYSTVHAVDYVTELLPSLVAKGTAPLQCTQEAGDMLYIPRGWGHAVLNLNTSVGYVIEFSTSMRRY